MSFINRIMLRRYRESDDLIWNTFGSAVYAVVSMVLGMVVTRLSGAVNGGIFFFAFSTLGQQLYIISYFGMRPVQITDTSGRHSFGDYLSFRLMTSFAAMLAGTVYIFVSSGDMYTAWIWLCMALYKIADGISDCFESELQRLGRLDMTGKSITFRTVFSVSVFIIMLICTKSLMLSSAVFIPALLIGTYLSAVSPLRATGRADYSSSRGSAAELFHEGKWLFSATFLDLYIFASAKYAVNAYMGAEYSGYFSTIFIPTSVINLMAGFIIRPVLTRLSAAYETGDRKGFDKTVLAIAGTIFIMTLAAMPAAGCIGIPVLSALLGEAGAMLLPYRKALVIIIFGGGAYAVLNLLYYVLVIYKRQRSIFAIYCIGSLLAFIISRRMVISHGIDGAAFSYAAVMMIMLLLFAGAVILHRRNNK